MLPHRLYEALPCIYLLIAALGAIASEFSRAGLLFGGALVALAVLVIIRRQAYRRRNAGWKGASRCG